jgi:FPC/CPF motif-containing protein YcgG
MSPLHCDVAFGIGCSPRLPQLVEDPPPIERSQTRWSCRSGRTKTYHCSSEFGWIKRTRSTADAQPIPRQFGTHRAVINGTFPIQEMSHVYACRHPKTSLAFDTTWIAAIFASQAFDTEQAYWLYESLMDRLTGEFKPIAIRVTSVVLPQLLAQQDQQLHADLSRKGFDSACKWRVNKFHPDTG